MAAVGLPGVWPMCHVVPWTWQVPWASRSLPPPHTGTFLCWDELYHSRDRSVKLPASQDQLFKPSEDDVHLWAYSWYLPMGRDRSPWHWHTYEGAYFYPELRFYSCKHCIYYWRKNTGCRIDIAQKAINLLLKSQKNAMRRTKQTQITVFGQS